MHKERAEGGPLYTILRYTFKILSAAPGIKLKGASHESCYVYILSDIEVRGAVLTRPNEYKIKGV